MQTQTSDLAPIFEALPDLSRADRLLIERAYERAREAHEGQFRNSGEPYIRHCLAVAQILADMKLDATSIAAALLHDIAKTRSIEQKDLRHDLIGAQMLRELGQNEIADICENHVIYNGFDKDSPVNEKDIVFYADKRVMHDRVVDIETRIADLVERYGKTEKIKEMIIHNKEFVLALEHKIESGMKHSLDQALKGL